MKRLLVIAHMLNGSRVTSILYDVESSHSLESQIRTINDDGNFTLSFTDTGGNDVVLDGTQIAYYEITWNDPGNPADEYDSPS